MAEQVQATLDTMVAPLRDLMDRGIFSDEEIKAIVSRRRASEYLLRRRAARKADFIRYIEDEIKLEELRSLRTRRLFGSNETPKSQLPIGDVHIVQNIHLLFVRALRKFRGDINLHLQHAEFSKAFHSYGRLSLIYTEALQVHPRHVPLWIEAASYEFFGHEHNGKMLGGGSIQTARVLLQRGLRINPTSCDLWLQYFSLEMHHVQKLKGRREILQITAGGDEPAPLSLIPKVVYQNAIKAISKDVSFRCKFLDLCRLFPQTQLLQNDITASMERDFSHIPEAWIARAAHLSETKEEIKEERLAKRPKRIGYTDPVLTLLQHGMKEIPTADMALKCLIFAKAYGGKLNDKTQVQMFVVDLFEKCHKEGIQSSDLVLEQSGYLTSHGEADASRKTVRQFCETTKDASLAVWIRWAQLEEEPETILERALEQACIDSNDYIVLLLELFGVLLHNKADENRVKDVFERILLLTPGRAIDVHAVFGVESVASACLQYLRYANTNGGLDKAREVMDHMLSRSNYLATTVGKTETDMNLLLNFFEECIDLEKANCSTKTKNQLRRLYDAAIHLFQEPLPSIAKAFRRKLDNDVRFAL